MELQSNLIGRVVRNLKYMGAKVSTVSSPKLGEKIAFGTLEWTLDAQWVDGRHWSVVIITQEFQEKGTLPQIPKKKRTRWDTASPAQVKKWKEESRRRMKGSSNPMRRNPPKRKAIESVVGNHGRISATTKAQLKRAIRQLPEYERWRQGVLQRDVKNYPIIKRGMQVHHITPLGKLLKQLNISTVEDAKLCAELWDIKLGRALTKGEHYIVSLMERKKEVSGGLIEAIKETIDAKENRALELEE